MNKKNTVAFCVISLMLSGCALGNRYGGISQSKIHVESESPAYSAWLVRNNKIFINDDEIYINGSGDFYVLQQTYRLYVLCNGEQKFVRNITIEGDARIILKSCAAEVYYG
jgi:outer membrane lipoprotein SlyB